MPRGKTEGETRDMMEGGDRTVTAQGFQMTKDWEKVSRTYSLHFPKKADVANCRLVTKGLP